MASTLQPLRISLSRASCSCAARRAASTKATAAWKNKGDLLVADGEIAQRLLKTGVWNGKRGPKKSGQKQLAVEPRRVNIVSKKLCDDVVKYIGPSLQRHKGCDLIDLNPGAGLWSQALHEAVEPRKHIMMDLDADLYQPYLSPLLAKDNVEMIPKSGLIWKDLFDMIRTRLSHQTETPASTTPTRNDTLLVTANLSMFPKKSYRGFDSISTMVLYQFLSSIRQSTLFQKYGLVRMLIWVNDEDKRRLLPRSLTRRRRSAFEAELSCEWLHDVASPDVEENRTALRDELLNLESGYKAVYHMKGMGLKMPTDRQTKLYARVMADPSLHGKRLAGVHDPHIARPFKKELDDLEGESSSSVDEARLRILRQRKKSEGAEGQEYLSLLQQRDEALTVYSSNPARFAALDEAWNARIDNFKKNSFNEFQLIRDNYHIFRQSPPALLWDRRHYEPLATADEEFFPNAPTALLDIQPKAAHPLLLQHGPESTRSGDMSDVMLRFWFQYLLDPAPKAMESLWAGFADSAASCPSLFDPTRGGSPLSNNGVLLARCINETQWVEILQAWMDWKFRPDFTRMLGRMADESEYEDEDGSRSGASGSRLG